VNVYYLTTQDGHRFFYYDASESSATKEEVAGGAKSSRLWTWAERKWGAIQAAMDDPEGGVTRRIGRVWNWLHSFCHPDEAMHVQFGAADEVVLHHPASEPVDRVRKAWKRYLRHRSRSHVVWAAVNSVVVPFATLLAILPGPNVIGFWFVYRAVYHFLGYRGIRRVRRGGVATRWRAEESLDKPVAYGEGFDPKHEALADGAKLGEYLQWSEPPAEGAEARPDDPNYDA
jgi:hypothetical protein